MVTVAWRDSRGHGGLVGRVRSWVASSACGKRGDIEGGPPRVSQQRAHSHQAEKCRSSQEGLREASWRRRHGPQMTKKNSGDGETRLERMVGTAVMKTTAGHRTSPEEHHSGPRPRLRGH